MNKDKILILGENGLIGFNAVRYFSVNNKFDIITCSRKNLDLRNQHEKLSKSSEFKLITESSLSL